ncbi:MAG: three-Cys-motif partner protein TcmP [Chloroflexi bacterium]|nr:three-Cys-motif partner protein TcmP [Chloroflexota bacterium]
MPPKTTTWDLEPHTRGKHLVLERYMQAWLPIMTSWNGRVLFIDAFAGPGEYSGGEPGSPVIALRTLINHSARSRIRSEVNYLFIENEKSRSKHLEGILVNLKGQIPPSCNYEVITSTFDETLTEVLDYIEEQRTRLAPAFVMIDPFGVSGTPMTTIARILENPRSEVYISFMYEWINRFKSQDEFGGHLDNLFGCPDWRRGLDIAGSEGTRNFYYNLYKSQLKKNGAKYVVHFELYEGNRHVYTIFFGTQHLDGCDRMKEAIWKVDPFGEFRFRGGLLDQLTLGTDIIDFSPLEQDLRAEFASKGWQKIEDVEDFVKSDATVFHSGQLKRNTLRPMEIDGKLEIKPGTRKRVRTYPTGTELRFL